MPMVLVLARDEELGRDLARSFPIGEFSVAAMSDPDLLATLTAEETPDLVVVDTTTITRADADRIYEFCHEARLPSLALVSEDALEGYAGEGGSADDFLRSPHHHAEMLVRARELLRRHRGARDPSTIRVDGLVIDQTRYDVTLGGRRVILTFKEYELLRLLASNPGRVFNRQELLSRVWGYDYFGGTRTVDVHIRRLRSKVEDANRTFIETVWSVGYRFRVPSRTL